MLSTYSISSVNDLVVCSILLRVYQVVIFSLLCHLCMYIMYMCLALDL